MWPIIQFAHLGTKESSLPSLFVEAFQIIRTALSFKQTHEYCFSLCRPLYNLGIYLLSVLPNRIDHLLLTYIHSSAFTTARKNNTPDPTPEFSITETQPTMSSSQTPISPSGKSTTITDLPPELITSIYKHLDQTSSISAFNSTCRKFHQIWQFDATSISSAVIYDRIPGFSTALELVHVQHKIWMSSSPPSTDRLIEIQQGAREAVLRDQNGGYRGATLSDGLHSTTLVANIFFRSFANKAYQAYKVYKWGIFPDGVVEPMYGGSLSLEDFTSAFYRLWILMKLVSCEDKRLRCEAMLERLRSIEGKDLEDMWTVVRWLVEDCPDNDRIYLGVSVPLNKEDRDFGMCYMHAVWAVALRAICEAHGSPRALEKAEDLQCQFGFCHEDCRHPGKSEVNEEELARRLMVPDHLQQIAGILD